MVFKAKLFIGADHAGFEMKEKIKKHLDNMEIDYEDISPNFDDSDDFPDAAKIVAEKVVADESKENRGLLVCGTGIGMAIAANKVPGARAVTPYTLEAARLSRAHNNANIITLGGRDGLPALETFAIIDLWLNTKYENQERLNRRNDKIALLEDYECKIHNQESE